MGFRDLFQSRLTRLNLGMTGPVCQRHEHFLVARGVLVDVVAHDRVLPCAERRE